MEEVAMSDSTIHAMAALERGAPLTPFAYGLGPLAPCDATVRVRACGVCRSDLHCIDDDWKRSRYPLVPGHEAIGEVVELGTGVTHLKIGDRVGVGWQRSSCLACDDCLSGDENLCEHSQATILDGYGGFGDHVRIDARFAFRIPEGIETLDAGPLLCGGITVYSALRAAGMRSGQHIGVLGVGGLGHLAVQFAAKLGNQVTAFTKSQDKAAFAARLGADDAIVCPGPAPGRKPARPLDILINTAPANQDWAAWLRLLGSDGTLTFVGIPEEPIVIPAGTLLDRRKRVMGSPIGGRAQMNEMLRLADAFGVRPVIETFDLADANRAVASVRDNTVRYRAVLVMP